MRHTSFGYQLRLWTDTEVQKKMQKYKVIYDFDAGEEAEMTVSVNDIVDLIGRISKFTSIYQFNFLKYFVS